MKLKDFPILNFSGGLVTNQSDLEMDKNTLKRVLNYDLDERGKLKSRFGYHIWGDSISGMKIAGTFAFTAFVAGSTPITYHLIVTEEANADLYKVMGNYLATAITTATTTITVGSTTDFATSGVVEIEGDLVAYTGKTGTTLTGVTGILTSHPAYAPVNQLTSISANIGVDTRSGVYFSVLNNTLFINGRAGSATLASDGSTVAAVGDADEPAGLFATNFRERIYVAGSGVADGSGNRNGSEIRVSFSDAGDSTSWDINNFFDAEDTIGERITGLHEGSNVLLIFKTNSTFVYNEVQLDQTLKGVGAWNNEVVKKIGDVIYTFCPRGVFATNGYSEKRISDPIQNYLKYFKPRYDTTVSRVVTNCCAGVMDEKYFLYIDQLDEPEALNNILFVYDTIRNNWTMYTLTLPESSNFIRSIGSLKDFNTGTPQPPSSGGSASQHGEALFFCPNDILSSPANGGIHKLFGVRYLELATTAYNNRGFDFYADAVLNNAGSPISAEAETQFYDLGTPHIKKLLPEIAAFVEKGDTQIAYKLDLGEGRMSEWISLGLFRGTMTKKLPVNQGYRIAFRFTSANTQIQNIFNGLIIKDPETLEKSKYGD